MKGVHGRNGGSGNRCHRHRWPQEGHRAVQLQDDPRSAHHAVQRASREALCRAHHVPAVLSETTVPGVGSRPRTVIPATASRCSASDALQGILKLGTDGSVPTSSGHAFRPRLRATPSDVPFESRNVFFRHARFLGRRPTTPHATMKKCKVRFSLIKRNKPKELHEGGSQESVTSG